MERLGNKIQELLWESLKRIKVIERKEVRKKWYDWYKKVRVGVSNIIE